MEIEKAYNFKKLEPKIYKTWDESGYFNPDNLPGERKSVFSIALPPPNVTGHLHMGHAAMLAIQDILIRYHRMKGDKTLWLPGTDHAAIATQEKVEKQLYKKEKKTRHDLGRKDFLKMVQDFAKESHDRIVSQVRSLGSSIDWSREAFTLDKERNLAVRTAFKSMYDAGLIYRGNRIVNWDPKLQTTVSDDEIEWKEETVDFYYIKYGPFTIGTARPETKFGDKYVVMHPNDDRYKEYKHGQKIELEWINGPITTTVIKDKVVDPDFGTGAMTITPSHDMTDFEIAERHNLDKEKIIDLKGKLLPIAGEFEGMHISKARKLIVEKIDKKGLLEKVDSKYTHRISTNSRGGGIIEPQILKQWFVNVNKDFTLKKSNIKGINSGDKVTLKELMQKVVQEKNVSIIPDRFTKTYFHWIDNLRDWCISRQIWYGHQISVWYRNWKPKGDEYTMGFHDRTYSQVMSGKTVTYRMREHGVKVGDHFGLINSQTKKIFGYGTIRKIERVTVADVPLADPAHGAVYKKRSELIEAFNFHKPELSITGKTPAWIYTYSFGPLVDGEVKEMFVGLEAPEEEGWTQDPDTLDTWFSSGLWTFSTLGWPENTEDLRNYHPTDILETGYDILFFWVARMILMSGFLLGEVPFKSVYLHGMVRDDKGRKMSKSLGNSIDPLEMAEKYGADATRLSLIIGTAPGNDVKLNENRIKGYKHFANKVWNATRFVLMNLDGYNKDYKPSFNDEDKKILTEFEDLKKEVTENIESYRFYLAGDKLYHYFWHTFADKIIEQSKKKLDGNERADAQALLMTILTGLLKMLHPFMPFVTEALWAKLPLEEKNLLMVEKW